MEVEKNSVQSMQTYKVVDGRYQVKDKQLGEGSFATTYLAYDTKEGKVIACKMISKKHLIGKINLSRNKSLTKQYFITALKNEVKAWKSLKHRNIVQFVDFSETANNIYFFMEYCSKGNLETLLRDKEHLSQQDALPIFFQLVSGCEYLYSLGIFHRDIKPENILVSSEDIMKISDFGFAKAIENEQSKDNPSAGTCVGTPIYMSPQVLLGDPYTIKCDVWSLGVMFYRIIVGLIPWQKTQNVNKLTERMKQPISFPPDMAIDEWVKNLIRGMMQVQQSQRLSIKDVKKILDDKLGHKMDVE